MPYDSFSNKKLEAFEQKETSLSDILHTDAYFHFSSGKEIIHHLMNKLGLTRKDEVYISTSSDSTFVSSCVTSTIFNYCKPSRVITENTKALFAIHEFGYPNKEIEALVEISKEKNIPLIEDTAHTLNSWHKGKRLGNFGDVSLISLPKSFPVISGGVLVTNNLSYYPTNINENEKIKLEINRWIKYLDSFTAKKRFIVEKYQQELEKYKVLYADNDKTNPFVYGIKHPNSDKLNQFLEKKEIQVGRTYVDSNVLLPVNPFMSIEDVHYCTDLITKYVEYDKS